MKNHAISFDEWQAAIDDAARDRADKVPPGWVTPAQFCALKTPPLSHSYGRNLLRRLLATGRADHKQFRVECDNGTIRPIWHYKLIKK